MASSVNGDAADAQPQRMGLSFIQFLILSSISSGVPFGMEYCVQAVGVEYTIIGLLFMGFFLSMPSALISTELISLMPSNHGQLAWCYRAFDHFKYEIGGQTVGNLLGFINAANLLFYYISAMPIMPIIFVAYLETLIGDLPAGYEYLVKLAVIFFSFFVNVLNVNTVGNVVNTLLLTSLSPLFLGFFIRLPDIELKQWTEECADMNWAYLSAIVLFYAGGYEALGALGGELNFSAKKLALAYGVSVILSLAMIICPIIAAATVPYTNCMDWYDGYFAVAYGEIWRPLYWMVMISCLMCMVSFIILFYAVGGRLVWAMAQDNFLVMPDGSMLVDKELSLMPINDRDELGAMHVFDPDNPEMMDGVRTIPLGVLHPILGTVWMRTGSPIGGMVFFMVWCMVLSSFFDYTDSVLMLCYTYIVTYFGVIGSFITMKFYEPDAPRRFAIPYGKTGGVVVTAVVGIITAFCAVFIGVSYYYWSALVCLCANILFVVYYFTIKRLCDRRADDEALIDDQMEPLLDDEADHFDPVVT